MISKQRLHPTIFVLSVSAAVFCLTSCSKPTTSASTPAVVRGINLFQLKAAEIPQIVTAVGTVQAKESATLSAEVTGRVLSVAVKEGDSTRMGQTLVSIDGAQLHSDLERSHAAVVASEHSVGVAESDSALAASTLQRYQILMGRKSISPQEFDEKRARAQEAASRVDVSRAEVAGAKAAEASATTMLGHTRIRSPFDGIVVSRKADPGTMATPGTPLLVVEKRGTLQLEVSVDESLLGAVRIGASIPVMIDAMRSSGVSGLILGRVSRIVPGGEGGSHAFLVKLDLPALASLRSGMYGRAEFSNGTRMTLTVPNSAVLHRGSLQEVFVVGEDRIANLRYITLGAARGNQSEVLSGLSAEERVVLSPGSQELDGKRIEAQP